jgi:hypothetical protein
MHGMCSYSNRSPPEFVLHNRTLDTTRSPLDFHWPSGLQTYYRNRNRLLARDPSSRGTDTDDLGTDVAVLADDGSLDETST